MIKIEYNGNTTFLHPVGSKVYTVKDATLRAWYVRKAEAIHTVVSLIEVIHWLEPVSYAHKADLVKWAGDRFYTSPEAAYEAFGKQDK